MKRQSILLGLLVISSGLHAITANDVLQKFNISFGTIFGQGYLFDKSVAAVQNQSLDRWSSAINDAKTFVAENSKNLVRVKDSDLINAMNKVEQASMALVNAIKITRGTSQVNAQKAIFAQIENDMKNLGNQMKAKSFTIAAKKEAQRVIVAVATYVESAANKAVKDLNNPPMPRDLPPVLPPRK